MAKANKRKEQLLLKKQREEDLRKQLVEAVEQRKSLNEKANTKNLEPIIEKIIEVINTLNSKRKEEFIRCIKISWYNFEKGKIVISPAEVFDLSNLLDEIECRKETWDLNTSLGEQASQTEYLITFEV